MQSKKDFTKSRQNIFLRYKIWLSTISGDGIISETQWDLLKALSETESISAAAKQVGISYRKAWGDLKSTEENLGYKLTVKFRGGNHGGKTILTDQAKKLLEAYAAMQKQFDASIESAFETFQEKMK
ncbi:winged helix-turn-helix domain-containing protein [Bacteroidota bacterium]